MIYCHEIQILYFTFYFLFFVIHQSQLNLIFFVKLTEKIYFIVKILFSVCNIARSYRSFKILNNIILNILLDLYYFF